MGGDITNNNGSGGQSIDNCLYNNENFNISHTGKGDLMMYNNSS